MITVKKMARNILCAFLIVICFAVFAEARTFDLNQTFSKLGVGKLLEYRVDLEDSLTLQNILSEKDDDAWMSSDDESLGFGFTTDVYWVRFSLVNTGKETAEFYLEQSYPLIDNLSFYYVIEKKVKEIEVGDHKKFSARPYEHRNFVFPLSLEAGARADCYARYSTTSSMNIVLNIWKPKLFEKESAQEYALIFSFYSVLLIMTIYNLILFFFIRRKQYLYYVIFILVYLVFMMTLNGTAIQFLWPDYPWWANFCLPLILSILVITLILFFSEVGQLRELKDKAKYLNNIYKVKNGHLYCSFVVTGLCLVLPYRQAMEISAIWMGVYLAVILVIGAFMIIREKSRSVFIFICASASIFVGSIAFVLKTFAILPTNIFTEWAVHLGSVVMVLLFSIALADRINSLAHDLKELNESLELKVIERTEELQAANEELEAANEEQEAMNVNLIEVNNELEEVGRIHRADLNMAASVQETFLPKEIPISDQYEIAYVFKPISGVSGDFYDFFMENNKLTGVGIFDVSGHGIASGLITLMAKSIILRVFSLMRDEKLDIVLERINQLLIREIGDTDNYLTGIILRFHNDIVEYVNSGHPDVLFRMAGTKSVGKVLDKKGESIRGMFLGVEAMRGQFTSLPFRMKSGDYVLLYTDCILETNNSAGVPYEEERLLESFRNAPEGKVDDTLDHLMKDFYDYIGGNRNISDDLTVLLIKRK